MTVDITFILSIEWGPSENFYLIEKILNLESWFLFLAVHHFLNLILTRTSFKNGVRLLPVFNPIIQEAGFD